jgi:hypothetical protein
VATYYTRTGHLDIEPVTEQTLDDAADRTILGARRLRDEQAGRAAVRARSGMCSECRWRSALPTVRPPAGGVETLEAVHP